MLNLDLVLYYIDYIDVSIFPISETLLGPDIFINGLLLFLSGNLTLYSKVPLGSVFLYNNN